MYNLKDFVKWSADIALGGKAVLAWSKREGYFFMGYEGCFDYMVAGNKFTIVAVEDK